MPKILEARADFVPSVVKGDLAKEMYSEITRPADARQIAVLKKAMANRVPSRGRKR